MKLYEFKQYLTKTEELVFKLPDGSRIPQHFHITEIGQVRKKFIDCGGRVREENRICLQIWYAQDKEHRLQPEKLINIIKLSEDHLNLEDSEIEVEYQGETIQKFNLEYRGSQFKLVPTFTDCLAKETCGVPRKPKLKLSDLMEQTCQPGTGCC